MSRRKSDLGDGDVCPLNPEHGQMFFLTGSDKQWCPDVDHSGRPANSPLGALPQTRSLWPQGHDSFRKAVIQTTLPEIDITLLGG